MSSTRRRASHFAPCHAPSPEERAFMARLAALNAAFEAARAGAPARGRAQEAYSVDELLERCFHALTHPGLA